MYIIWAKTTSWKLWSVSWLFEKDLCLCPVLVMRFHFQIFIAHLFRISTDLRTETLSLHFDKRKCNIWERNFSLKGALTCLVQNRNGKMAGFWNFARSRSREIQVYPRNWQKTVEIPRNSLEILPNTCRYNIFETYLGYWSCLLAVNLQIYLEISSLPRVNIVPKLSGVL